MKKLKKIPKFKSEKEERAFWSKHDSVDYIDWSKAEQIVFRDLKPSTETISLRLSASLLSRLKTEAHKQDVPYQSLIKVLLSKSFQK